MLQLTTRLDAGQARLLQILTIAFSAVGLPAGDLVPDDTCDGPGFTLGNEWFIYRTTVLRETLKGKLEVPGYGAVRITWRSGGYWDPPEPEDHEIYEGEQLGMAVEAFALAILREQMAAALDAHAEHEALLAEQAELKRLGCTGFNCRNSSCPIHADPYEESSEGLTPDQMERSDLAYEMERDRRRTRRLGP